MNDTTSPISLTPNKTQKSMLGRLLATEDIVVEHHPDAPTAYFDVKNRVLVLPQWKDMSDQLYDMLVGHEVGHALYTPAEDTSGRELPELLDDIAGNGGNIQLVKALLNIVEDARIERLMQDKFPGLKRDFVAAYDDLHNARDFFGIGDKDLSDSSFADRINLHFKIGNMINVPFSMDEQLIVDRIGVTDSFEDVIQIVRDMYPAVKKEMDERQEMKEADASLDGAGEDEDGEGSGGDGGWMQPEDADTEDGDGAGDGEGDDEDGEDSGASAEDDTDDGESAESVEGDAPSNSSGAVDGEELPQGSGLETVDAFERKMEELVDDDRYNKNKYATLAKFDYKDWVIDTDKTFEGLAAYPAGYHRHDAQPSAELAAQLCKSLSRKVAKGANLLAKQFEMKKAADAHKRTVISKTGVLDTVKMVNYKTSDDIFRKNSTVTEGKNHGLVSFIDWSGSMDDCMGATIEQMYLLATFCKKVNIPFDFYAFSSQTPWRRAWGHQEGEDMQKCPITAIDDHDEDGNRITDDVQPSENMCLYRFVHSGLNNRDYKKSMEGLAMLHHHYTTGRSRGPHGNILVRVPMQLQLGGTPLDDCIVLARNLVRDFRKNNNLQIVHTIFLTDGDSHGGCVETNHSHLRDGRKIITREKIDGYYRGEGTKFLLEWFRATTGCKAIGMFLTNNWRSAASRMGNQQVLFEEVQIQKKKFIKEKFLNAGEAHGYSEFFILKSDTKVETGADFDEVDADISFTKLRSAFVKAQQGALVSRTVLNRVADLLAV
jgi:hypothetical protein